MEYFCDSQKSHLRLNKPLHLTKRDVVGKQNVDIVESIYGITIIPEGRWTSFCEKLFLKYRANGVSLGGLFGDWRGNLSFLHELNACIRVYVSYSIGNYIQTLDGNPHIESLRLKFNGSKNAGELDLRSLPNLRQCCIPAEKGFDTYLLCPNLLSVWLLRGKVEGILDLSSLTKLEEISCEAVHKIRGLRFSPLARLRAIALTSLRSFEIIDPIESVTEELLVATIDRVPNLPIEWLGKASKAECVSLQGLKIPSLKFLEKLRKLQVLDLFGSKLIDRDFSFVTSLPQHMDKHSWSARVER